MSVRTMTVDELHATLRGQGVSAREHVAVKCPICGTVQSLADFADAGVMADTAERQIAFSCIGRWTNSGRHQHGTPPGRGCDWTLGGLFQLHRLEVVTPDGKHHPRFEPATAEEAQAHERDRALRKAPGEQA